MTGHSRQLRRPWGSSSCRTGGNLEDGSPEVVFITRLTSVDCNRGGHHAGSSSPGPVVGAHRAQHAELDQDLDVGMDSAHAHPVPMRPAVADPAQRSPDGRRPLAREGGRFRKLLREAPRRGLGNTRDASGYAVDRALRV